VIWTCGVNNYQTILDVDAGRFLKGVISVPVYS
jgi:hypothetical protein